MYERMAHAIGNYKGRKEYWSVIGYWMLKVTVKIVCGWLSMSVVCRVPTRPGKAGNYLLARKTWKKNQETGP